MVNFLRVVRSLRGRLFAWLVLVVSLTFFVASFAIFDTVLIRPLEFRSPEQLVHVGLIHRERGESFGEFSPDDVHDIRASSRSLQRASSYYYWPGHSVGVLRTESGPTEVDVAYFDADFFSVLGVDSALGTSVQSQISTNEVVLSHRFWTEVLGADQQTIGRSIVITGKQYLVRAVMPKSFEFPSRDADIWLPLDNISDEETPRNRDIRWLDVVARIGADASLEAANTEVSAVVGNLSREYPRSNGKYISAKLIRLSDKAADSNLGLMVVLASSVFLLVVSSINFSALMLAEFEAKSRDYSVRAALGATRLSLFLHYAASVLTVSLSALAIALGASWVILTGAGKLLAQYLPRMSELTLHANVLWAGIAGAAVAAIIAVVAPGFRLWRMNLATHLVRSGVSGNSASSRLRSVLLICQVTLVVSLLYVSGTMFERLTRQLNGSVGLNNTNVQSFAISFQGGKYGNDESISRVSRAVIAQTSSLAGVDGVAAGKNKLLGEVGERYGVQLSEAADSWVTPDWGFFFVTEQFFEVVGTPMLMGTSFDEDAIGEDIPAIVNATFAQKYFNNAPVIGMRLRTGLGKYINIVGVAVDIRHLGPHVDAKPALYLPLRAFPRSSMSLFVKPRTSGISASHVLAAAHDLDADLPVSVVGSLADQKHELFSAIELASDGLAAFALVSTLVASFGVFALTRYVLELRRREFCVRAAMGSNKSRLSVLVLKYVGVRLLVGISVGALLGFVLVELISGAVPWVSSDALVVAFVAGVSLLSFSAVAMVPSVLWMRKLSVADLVRD